MTSPPSGELRVLADGLSSSAYGPEETFRAIGEHHHLAVALAAAMMTTILVISIAYSQIIKRFPFSEHVPDERRGREDGPWRHLSHGDRVEELGLRLSTLCRRQSMNYWRHRRSATSHNHLTRKRRLHTEIQDIMFERWEATAFRSHRFEASE